MAIAQSVVEGVTQGVLQQVIQGHGAVAAPVVMSTPVCPAQEIRHREVSEVPQGVPPQMVVGVGAAGVVASLAVVGCCGARTGQRERHGRRDERMDREDLENDVRILMTDLYEGQRVMMEALMGVMRRGRELPRGYLEEYEKMANRVLQGAGVLNLGDLGGGVRRQAQMMERTFLLQGRPGVELARERQGEIRVVMTEEMEIERVAEFRSLRDELQEAHAAVRSEVEEESQRLRKMELKLRTELKEYVEGVSWRSRP